MDISQDQSDQLIELLEDTIEFYCDQQMISGQLAWIATECVATAKVAEFSSQLTT